MRHPVYMMACVFLILLGIVPRSEAAGEQARPNLLVILADDLGWGDLSSQGATDLQTPHLDALAARGVSMPAFYANCPVCSPTRASLLTGRYPDLVGVPGVIRTHPENSWGYLAHGAILLPQVLKQAGYDTALIGKWHLGLASPNTPHERGFDVFRGFLGDMMDDYYDHRRHGINYMRNNEAEIDPTGHATDLFSQWAEEYLNTRRAAERPFFLYLAYNAPHTPIQPPPDWLAKVRQREPNLHERRARLVALIEHLDAGIGKVLATLEKTGLAGNTLVVFTSDNGGQLNVGANCGPWRGGKGDLYEGGLRVPFCAVWPGRIQPGTESGQVAVTMDLFPTLCEAAQAPYPHTIEGVSLLKLWRGETTTLAGRDLFWMRREGGGPYRGQDYQAMRRGDWKLVQNHPFEPYQLYHLGDDPEEQRDRAQSEPALYEAMGRALQGHLQKAGAVPWQP